MTQQLAQTQKGVLLRKHKYCVYILASRSGALYIEMTNDLRARVMQRKEGKMEGFTAAYKVDRLVYWEGFDEVAKAINRERQLKAWRRSKRIAQVESVNPHWSDLAEHWGAKMSLPGLGG
jgi:putative endonuclease